MSVQKPIPPNVMPIRHGYGMSVAIGLLCLNLAACSAFMPDDSDAPDRIMLDIQGAVTSTAGGVPLQGVTVDLIAGGYFSVPVRVHTTSTDQDGRYAIEMEIGDPEESFLGCQLHISFHADGYTTVSQSSQSVGCVPERQTIDARLEPSNE